MNKRILAKPILEEVYTNSQIDGELTEKEIKEINKNDAIPDLFAEEIAANAKRNQTIVQTYYDYREKYGTSDDELLIISIDEEPVPVRQTVPNIYEYLTNYFFKRETTENSVQVNNNAYKEIQENEIKYDKKMEDVLKFCINRDTVSVSLLQRKFGMGYARAGRIVDDLERLGIVEKFAGSKPRKINHTELEKVIPK